MHSAGNHSAGIGADQNRELISQGLMPGVPLVTPSLTSRPVAQSPSLSYDVSNTTEGLLPVGEFGNKFRQAREKKELSFDDVSNVTKISSRMLQAIEEEHFDQLPGGVFNKGFIRAYAKHLGLNPEDAVSDYLACLRQAQIDSHAGWDAEVRNARPAEARPEKGKSPQGPIAKEVLKPNPPEQVEELPELQLPRAEDIRPGKKEYLGTPSSGTPWTLIAALALVAVAGIFFWIRHTRAARGPAISSAPVIASAAAPPATTAGPSTLPPTSNLPAQPQAPSPSTAAAATPTSSVTPATNAQQSAKADNLASAGAAKPAPSAPTSADPTEVKVERKGDVTIRSFGGSTLKTADSSAAKLTLVIRASENSWISVTSDGQLITQETLIAPAATSFHASRELVVRVGNAAGVSFLWNGDEVSAQGAEAEAKTFVFDAQGMRAAAQAQAPTQNQ